MSAYRCVDYLEDGPARHHHFRRPEWMNAIGVEMSTSLVEAWTRFRDDDSAPVAVLTGRGDGAFCAG